MGMKKKRDTNVGIPLLRQESIAQDLPGIIDR